MNPDIAESTSPTRVVDDPAADPALRALLTEASAQPLVSDAELARFSKRFGAMVGLPLLASAPLVQAPPSPAGLETLGQASPGALSPAAQAAGAKIAGAKLIGGSVAAKVAAVSLAVGATLWFVHDARRPQQVAAPVVQAPSAAPALSVSAPAPAPAIEALPSPSAAEPARKRITRAATRSERAEAPVPDELALIHEAQSLRSEPVRALAVLAQHRKHYPSGMLAQEREVLSVEALQAAGRRQEAAARAAAFIKAHPSSVHVARLRTLLGAALAE